MSERPRFVFDQEEEEDEVATSQPTATKAKTSKASNQLQETKAAAKVKQGTTTRHSRSNLKKTGMTRDAKEITSTPKVQIQGQTAENISNGSMDLKYSQVENHFSTTGSNPSSILNRKTENSVVFQDKMSTHFQEAKSMRPNTMFREENQSPIPQQDQRKLVMPAPQPEFDPYKYTGYSKQNRINKKDYQGFLDSSPNSKKKKTSSKPIVELELPNQSKILDHSHAELQIPSSAIIPTQEPIIEPSNRVVQTVLAFPAPKSSPSYFFTIDKKFGVNYFYPDFKIWSNEEQLLVSAKKEALHFNSYYNIYAGESKEERKMGYIRGNFGGTQFNVYQCQEGGDEIIGTVIYRSECSFNAYRKMEVYIRNANMQNKELFKGDQTLKELYEKGGNAEIRKLVTKQPEWREDLKCYVMNFKGHGKMSSTKNTILVDEDSKEDKLLFCKRSANKYYLEIGRPFNLLVSMGVLLTSFDFKLLCQ